MSEIYLIYQVEKYNYPDDSGEIEKYLGTWEKIGNRIREVRWDYHDYEIEGSICETIKRNGKYSYIFQELDQYTQMELKAVKTNQKRGVYYPKIFLPICSDNDLSEVKMSHTQEELILTNGLPYDESYLIKSLEQLLTLFDSAKKILRTVFPCERNFEVFGFDIRNVLILACTEFESQCVGILKANNIVPKGKHYNTNDYIKIKEITRISEYKVRFNLYPELQAFQPFETWNKSNTTESIGWYANYNAVKHDRESNFNRGKLIDMLNSIAACYIMTFVQFGELPIINRLIGNYMSIVDRPRWEFYEKYIKPYKNEEWRMENYEG